jgi:hypothetical protein
MLLLRNRKRNTFFLPNETVGRVKILKILVGEIKFLGFFMYSEVLFHFYKFY